MKLVYLSLRFLYREVMTKLFCFSLFLPTWPVFTIPLYSVQCIQCILEIFLENPGFVNPSNPTPAASPGSGLPLPPSGSSLSSTSLPASDDAHRQCPQCHRRISKLVYECHNFCSRCCGLECSVDSRCHECADWSREEMETYVNPQTPDGVYKPPLVYCRMGFIKKSPISRAAFEQKRGKSV